MIVSISSPSSSSTWSKGTNYEIIWTMDMPEVNVTINLYYEEDTFVENIVTDLYCDTIDGSYYWTPSTGLTTRTDYLLKIDDGDDYKWSEFFTIIKTTSSSITDSLSVSDEATEISPSLWSWADSVSISDEATEISPSLWSWADSVSIGDSTKQYDYSPEVKTQTSTFSTILSFNVKFYIQDANKHWVDFTDKLERRGKYKLADIGSISHTTETQAIGGNFTSSISNVSMDNSDGFWDDPSQWQSLKTINSSSATFNVSKNGREISLEKAKCRVVIESVLKDGSIREDTVGVFRIRGFSTDSKSGITELEIESLSQSLKDLKADKVKNGKAWYENRSIVFLVQELLKLEFADKVTNTLPASFKFPTQVSIPTYDGSRVLSSFGRPPERIG